MALLKKFFESVGKKDDSVLGIDISSSSIKVVQIRNKKGRAVLETYGELALGPYAGSEVGHSTSLSSEKIAEALSDLLKEAKATTLNAGISIPYSSSLISLIQMPAVGEKKLKEMVPIESRKFIPVPISEVMLDWTIIPKRSADPETEGEEEADLEKKKDHYDKVDVLVVAIHKDTINRFQKISEVVGLDTSFFEIEVFSTIRAVMHGESDPVMVVDIGAGNTKVFVVDHRMLRDTHIINKGSQHITTSLSQSLTLSPERAEEMKREIGILPQSADDNAREVSSTILDSIFAEAKRVMLSYQKKNNTSISKVVMTGGGSILKGLREKAVESFEADVVMADPFSKIETPAFLENVLRDAGPEFAVAIGVALRKLDELV